MLREEIQKAIIRIGMDKIAHFFACAFLTLAIGHFFHWGIAAGVTLAIGLAKELMDKNIDKYDLLADAAGVLLGLLILLV